MASDNRRADAVALHRAGRLDEAKALYIAVLETAPGDVDLLGLLGVVAMQQGDIAEAERRLRSGLIAPPDASLATRKLVLRNLNNLLVMLINAGRLSQAATLAKERPPVWPEADGGDDRAAPDDKERGWLRSLVMALLRTDRTERADALWRQVRRHFDDDAVTLELDGRVALALEAPERALEPLKRALEATSGLGTAVALAVAAARAGDAKTAASARAAAAARAAVYTAAAHPDQRATVTVLNAPPMRLALGMEAPAKLHFHAHYIAERAAETPNDYRFVSVFPDFAREDELRAAPKPALVVNNIAGADAITDDQAAAIDRAVAALGAPVVNPVAAMRATARPAIERIANATTNMVAPKRVWVERTTASGAEVARRLGAEIGYPMVLQRVGASDGASNAASPGAGDAASKTTVKVDAETEAAAFLNTAHWSSFYAAQFLDLRRDDGAYRKHRAAFIGDEWILPTAAAGPDWMIGGWPLGDGAVEFYRSNPEIARALQATLADPITHLGAPAIAALQNLRAQLALDFFGVDFDVDRDGRVVLFELSAGMRFLRHFDGPPNLRPPREPFERLNAAFDQLIARKIADAAAPAHVNGAATP